MNCSEALSPVEANQQTEDLLLEFLSRKPEYELLDPGPHVIDNFGIRTSQGIADVTVDSGALRTYLITHMGFAADPGHALSATRALNNLVISFGKRRFSESYASSVFAYHLNQGASYEEAYHEAASALRDHKILSVTRLGELGSFQASDPPFLYFNLRQMLFWGYNFDRYFPGFFRHEAEHFFDSTDEDRRSEMVGAGCFAWLLAGGAACALTAALEAYMLSTVDGSYKPESCLCKRYSRSSIWDNWRNGRAQDWLLP